ncbi:AAA family ATPase [Falsiporphyromonas endometrii]|uniref:AAA family ATPase n=1 Tax=Falsiporphyromonas endometrii TaxID=1387297 RepID=A0ABV9K8L4_9PORP
MKNYISKIKINDLLHLKGLEIDLSNPKFPHLIITGRNGSGKTTLLNAMADFLDKTTKDNNLYFLKYRDWVDYTKERLQRCNTDIERVTLQQELKEKENWVADLYGKVELLLDFADILHLFQEGQFIIAFYPAMREPKIIEPKNPTKPNLTTTKNIRESATSQFLYFLSDLKIQEALARNEGQITDADEIAQWFGDFERMLKHIYSDDALRLEFNYRDYSFRINSRGQSFKLTQLSDGYAAIIEIIADLILRMQDKESLSRVYDKKGVVLIDEIETHLHLKLQKEILPFLTTVFPNIQFIVTTHSPFVLSSLPSAMAYDLEHQEELTDLTEYSFEALSEGYFQVKSQSSYIMSELNRLKELVLQERSLTESEKIEVREIIRNFDSISESVLPAPKGEYNAFYIGHAKRIKEILEEV